MRRVIQLTALLVFLFPLTLEAACLEKGYTVVLINGIFNTREQADYSRVSLEQKLKGRFNGEDVVVRLGYNPSHLAGLGDLTQIAFQSFGGSVSSFDRDTILLQIHPEVATQKILLVGHSQGTLYTNDIYNYLIGEGGVSSKSVGVYNVATPANYVAGGGHYLTSKYDSIIDLYAEYARISGALVPLPPNTELEFGSSIGNGHSFTENYLKYGAGEIIADAQASFGRLHAVAPDTVDGCFTPPSEGLGYQAQKAFFAVADPAAAGIKVSAVYGFKGLAFVYDTAKTGLVAAGSLFGSLANAVIPAPRTSNLPGSHTVVDALYGSSLDEQDLQDLLGSGQSGAVVLAGTKKEAESNNEIVEDNGEVRGVEIEKTPEPLIPPPLPGGELVSPGFGGGGGSGVTESEGQAASSGGSTGASPSSSTPIVPDGVPPSLVSLAADGFALQSSYASLLQAPLATSGTTWLVRMEFDEDVAVAPVAIDTSNSSPRTSHTVDDCGDADFKTFCFTYPATPGQQASTVSRLDQWTFEISGAEDASGEVMTTATYSFSIETLAPTVTPGVGATNSTLPTIGGKVSEHHTTIQVLIDGHFLTTTVGDPFIFIPGTFDWGVTLSPGQELAEGYYDVQASSTDAVGNTGPIATWQMLVDLTPPTIVLAPDIVEGSSIATTVGHVQVQSSDNNTGVSHTCDIDGFFSVNCTGLDVSGLAAGAHTLKVVATDIGGNQTTLLKNFTVLP